jgi:pilus assembly protein CpaF
MNAGAEEGQSATTEPAAGGARVDGFAVAYEASTRFFLGPLLPLLEDETISEIMVNGPDRIYIERAGLIERSEARFASEHDLRSAANNIAQFVGKSVSAEEPLLDGRLPDGSRVCIVLGPPIAAGGTSINIRRFLRQAVEPSFLLERRSITPPALETLKLAVMAHQNVIVSGGTGSGKTTLLNILSSYFDDSERIVVIEDTRELQIQKEHVVQLEARPPDPYGRGEITVRDLFVTSLRMRPDRIVVGEVRRGEAIDMIQAMTSGHRGSLATLHASTPADACRRLETMALMADVGLPLAALRRQVASAIDLIVQVNRLSSGRRLVTNLSEVGFDEVTSTYQVEDIFSLQEDSGGEPMLRWVGRRPRLADEIKWRGLGDQIREATDVFGSKP